MSALSLSWIISFGVLALSLALGVLLRRRTLRGNTSAIPQSFTEFFSGEMYDLGHRLLYIVARMFLALRPPVQRVLHVFRVMRERLSAHVFGRITIDRRSASSFFLKHIAEHQELLRRRMRSRGRTDGGV
jgi:hypothetical protein